MDNLSTYINFIYNNCGYVLLIPIMIWFDSLNYTLMSAVYLVGTIYFTIS